MAHEIEIKVNLGSFANYLKLLGHLGETGHEEHQRNSFFDTKNQILKMQGWALRLRTTDTTSFITLKGTTSQSGAAAVREEIESEIPRVLATEVLTEERDIMSVTSPPVDRIRSIINDAPLYRFLSFDNFRRTHPYRLQDGEYMFEVDKTEFDDGHVDYELEIELDTKLKVDSLIHELGRLFSSLDIPFVPQTESKFARALRHTHR